MFFSLFSTINNQLIFIISSVYLDQHTRIGYVSHLRVAKAQTSLYIRTVSPEPLLLVYTKYEIEVSSDQTLDYKFLWIHKHEDLLEALRMRGSRGGQEVRTPPPLENHKAIGLSILI